MTEQQTTFKRLTSTRTNKYPSDVTDAEWEFLAPFLTLMTEEAPQRDYPLRDVFDGLRYIVRSGAPWRFLPKDFPPWSAVYQQARRWQQAGVFETIAHELRIIERILKDRQESPSAVILDGRTLRSTPESGHRASYDGYKKTNGSKVHIAVDTLGNLLAVVITGGKDQERHQVGELTEHLQQVTGGTVEVAFVDQGYTGQDAAEAAAAHRVELEVVKTSEAKKGFVLLPRRWVVERTFGWLARHRRLARDYERLTQTLAAYHWVAFIGVLLTRIQLAPFSSA
jgi:transposase